MLTNPEKEYNQNANYLKKMAIKIIAIKPNDTQAIHNLQFIEKNYDKILRNRQLIEILG